MMERLVAEIKALQDRMDISHAEMKAGHEQMMAEMKAHQGRMEALVDVSLSLKDNGHPPIDIVKNVLQFCWPKYSLNISKFIYIQYVSFLPSSNIIW
jgi:hypothetical protein